MRRLLPVIIALVALSNAGCSYVTDFVIVNKSDQTIQVRYKVKAESVGPPTFEPRPAKIAASEMKTRDKKAWRNLRPDEYQVDQKTRTVTVNVAPNEALWVTSMFHYFGDSDPNDIAKWPLDEITLTGTEGEMTFTGDKTRQAFEYVSQVLYTLTYK
jgi:hypothetical protein